MKTSRRQFSFVDKFHLRNPALTFPKYRPCLPETATLRGFFPCNSKAAIHRLGTHYPYTLDMRDRTFRGPVNIDGGKKENILRDQSRIMEKFLPPP